MGATTRVFNPLQFVTLYKGAEEISSGAKPWISLWWVESLKNMTPGDWLKKGDILLWETPPLDAKTEL